MPDFHPTPAQLAAANNTELRPVVGHEGYDIDSNGVLWTRWSRRGRFVFIGKDRKPMRPSPASNGYYRVRLKSGSVLKRRFVHHLVLEAFVGPRPCGFETRHINGNPLDNRPCNLAWGTAADNCDDRLRHGTQPTGERNGFSKLTEAGVREIMRRRKNGTSVSALAKEYGVHRATIQRAATGQRWRRVVDAAKQEVRQC